MSKNGENAALVGRFMVLHLGANPDTIGTTLAVKRTPIKFTTPPSTARVSNHHQKPTLTALNQIRV